MSRYFPPAAIERISIQDNHILDAVLKNDQQELVIDQVNLNKYLGNVNGSLTWGRRGFATNAGPVRFTFEDGVPTLHAFLMDNKGSLMESSINLDDDIIIVNGQFKVWHKYRFNVDADNLRLEGKNRLRATLKDDEGNPQEHGIYLNEIIGNSDGELTWGGEHFSQDASKVSFSIENGRPILHATLPDRRHYWSDKKLDLSERIENNNGRFEYRSTDWAWY